MDELIKKIDKELEVISYEYIDNNVIIYAKRTNKSAICPFCYQKSTSVNSRYYRTIKDLPIQDNKVILKLEAKTFICKNNKCSIKTFSEKFDFIESRARMTTRLKDRIVNDSKGMSARSAKKTISSGLVNISDDTILRLLKKNKKR